jgi:hypothetical protein
MDLLEGAYQRLMPVKKTKAKISDRDAQWLELARPWADGGRRAASDATHRHELLIGGATERVESTEFRIDSMQFICTLEVVATIHLPFSLAEDIEGRLCLGKLKFESRHFEMSRLTGAESIFSGAECDGHPS